MQPQTETRTGDGAAAAAAVAQPKAGPNNDLCMWCDGDCNDPQYGGPCTACGGSGFKGSNSRCHQRYDAAKQGKD